MSNYRSRTITIFSIGNPLQKWVKEGIQHYQLQSKKWININCIHLTKAPSTPTEQWHKIQPKLNTQDVLIALDVLGKNLNTTNFKDNMNSILQDQSISFIIGGASGLSKECLKSSKKIWSLSHLTFSHTLVPILLVEQIYRSMSIIHQHPYHKS